MEGSQIDDAKERLVRLARRIEVNVNFRRLSFFIYLFQYCLLDGLLYFSEPTI